MEKSTSTNNGIRPSLIVAAIALVGVVVIGGRMLGRRGTDNPGATNSPAPAASAGPATAPVLASHSGARPAASTGPTAPGATSQNPPRPASSKPVNVPGIPGTVTATAPTPDPNAEWTEKLDGILSSDDNEAKKAEQRLAIWKTLPEDGQVEIMQHISNLLPDEKFSALAQTFTNASTPEAVLDIIMTDTLNRPNGIKLPVLLDVARTPGHPKA